MCTLTYLPLENNQFIITTNRDESVLRAPALPPQVLQRESGKILCPVDGKAKGTWIATSDVGVTACLLNGAFEKHQHTGNYRMSRGQVVMEIFDFEDTDTFVNEYNFEGIEPFTLVLLDTKQHLRLMELRWNGQRKYVQAMDTDTPHLWASATLYTPEMIVKRKQWFAEWLAQDPEFTQENIVNFHKSAGEGDAENDLVMRRGPELRTVSITSVWSKETEDIMYYENLVNGQQLTQSLIKQAMHSVK